MSYAVAIPSYQRPDRLFEHSLHTLATKNVPMDQVHVFLHDNDPHLDTYLMKLDLLGVHAVVTQARGIGEQRAAITNYFEPGQQVVGMDDDIQGVMSATGPRWAHAYQVEDLDELFKYMFAEADDHGLAVWGLAPVDNPFFLKPGQVSTGLKLVMFTLFGFINRPGHPVHTSTVQYKDEQEFSLRAWWYDGGVARNDGVAVKTVFYADGGCQAEGRNVQQVEDLDALFKDMFRITREERLSVWGLAPVDNPFFLKPGQVSTGLKLVMFTLFGFINRPGHPVHTSTVQYKDEQEFSLRAWWYDGGVARNDGVAVKTVFYADGGCQAEGRNVQQVEDSVESLLVQWPGLISRAPKRKSTWPEVKLARRKAHDGHANDVPPPGAHVLAELQDLI